MDKIVGTFPPGDWMVSWEEGYEDGSTVILTEPIIGWVVEETGLAYALVRDGLSVDAVPADSAHRIHLKGQAWREPGPHLPGTDPRRRI